MLLASAIAWSLVVSPRDADPGREAWGGFAHRAAATVAAELLTPATRQRIQALLGDSTLASVSVWADDVRMTLRETAAWHFVNIPIDAAGYDSAAHCPRGDCVIEVIRFHRRILADAAVPQGARLQALKYLIHFVSDLHQPLHVGDNQNRGGNDLLVELPEGGQQRLHSLWDAGLLEMASWSEARLTVEVGIRARANRRSWEGRDVLDWAEEARRLARDHGYRLPASGRLDGRYLADGAEVAVTQLARSAVRLAELLNRALDPS